MKKKTHTENDQQEVSDTLRQRQTKHMSLEQHEQDNDQNTFLTFTPTHRMKITRTRTSSLVKEIKYTHAWDTFNRKIHRHFLG